MWLENNGNKKKKPDKLGIEPPFLGFEQYAIQNFSGKIPKLPQQVPPSQNPRSFYQKTFNIVSTGAVQDLEPLDATKVYYIYEIHFQLQGPYQSVTIWDMDDLILSGSAGVDAALVYHDKFFSSVAEILLKGRIAFQTGGAGDNCWITIIGEVQNK